MHILTGYSPFLISLLSVATEVTFELDELYGGYYSLLFRGLGSLVGPVSSFPCSQLQGW
jgi:hypothetical protein